MRRYSVFVMILVSVVAVLPAARVMAGVTERVSVASDGTQGNGGSGIDGGLSISADGRFVAFYSYASNLVTGDTNSTYDIFVHDRQTGVTERVSVATGGAQGNSNSYYSSISADGRFVAFESYASNLVPGDTNDTVDVFVHDRQTGVTSRVSIATGGAQGNGGSNRPSISADGRVVAFESVADNLVPEDTNGRCDGFIHDRQTGSTQRVSAATGGAQENNSSACFFISADGRFVAFQSDASNLIPGDTNDYGDVFVHDRQTGSTERVSVATGGAQGDWNSYGGSISADDRFVVFTSYASNLIPGDTNGAPDVFIHDRQTGSTERVSVATGGTQGAWNSYGGSLSADDRFVAFMSHASNLVPGDTNGALDVFIHNRQTGVTSRVSVATGGAQGNSESNAYSISADGRFVAFYSYASNLVPGDTNGALDVFVHDCWTDGVAPGNMSLTISPTQVTLEQTVTATAVAPGASSVSLAFTAYGITVPGVAMSTTGDDRWTASFNSRPFVRAGVKTVTLTATAHYPSGMTITKSATLLIGSSTPPPPTGSGVLKVWCDDTNAYGLASGSAEDINPGGNPLDSKLLVTQDLNLWFGVDVSCSGTATWSRPSGYSVPELMGNVWLVNPEGTVAEIGHFRNANDTVTLSLNLNSGLAPIANMSMILLHLVPGGTAASPENIVDILQDIKAIGAVKSAATELFGSRHNSAWEWAKSAARAAWSLKSLVSDDTQKSLLSSAFNKIGVTVSKGDIGLMADSLGTWDLLKIISSEIAYIVQTQGRTIDCRFEAYNSDSGLMTAAMASGTSLAQSPASAALVGVTWDATPSATDWLISYTVTNNGQSLLWSFSVFCDPSAGAPTQVLSPTGWKSTVNSEDGTITWYTEGPGGWSTGDFGSSAIQPGAALSGFSIRHTAAPDYSMCCATDTSYGSAFAQVAAPSPHHDLYGVKTRGAGDKVAVADAIVSAVLPNGIYYVEEPDRHMGIRVSGGSQPAEGNMVRVVGTLAVTGGEAQVNATACAVSGSGNISPLGIQGKSTGGRSLAIQPGVEGGVGPNNVGLLIRNWGKVTQKGVDYLYINDGSNLKDGTMTGIEENIGVRVICDPTGYNKDDLIAVTGVSSSFTTDAGSIARQVITRRGADINRLGS
ncbi:MAG: hypothetical protein M1133_09600 [Armatimonadetes bacterium]|nr:hypothetical protein [Armatimonadota bacterium]